MELEPHKTMMKMPNGTVMSHFDVGKLLGTIMLGAVDGLAAYTNAAEIPSAIDNFTKGILSIWFPAAVPQSPTAPVVNNKV